MHHESSLEEGLWTPLLGTVFQFSCTSAKHETCCEIWKPNPTGKSRPSERFEKSGLVLTRQNAKIGYFLESPPCHEPQCQLFRSPIPETDCK